MEIAMNCKLSKICIATVTTCTLALPALAATERIELLGTPDPHTTVDRTIAVGPNTQYVNVTGGEIIAFVVKNKSFSWHFNGANGITSFKLKQIVPNGISLERDVNVYVAPDAKRVGAGV